MTTTSPRNDTGIGADHYALPGVRFSLTTDDAQVRDFFRAAYRHFEMPAGSAPAQPVYPLKAMLRPDNGRPFASAGEHVLDLSGRAMPVNRAFLFLLNGMMEQVSEFVVMHAAAVSVAGRGILVAGSPTAGKSTLALELARRGAAFLSDDVAPLHRKTGLLHAFPRALGIRRDAEGVSRVDRASLPAGSVHELAYKWLVDPAALGLRLAGPGDAPCPVEAIFLLDTDPPGAPPRGDAADGGRQMEIALAEEDEEVLAEVRSLPGVEDLRRHASRPFPVYSFTARPALRPMAALADLGRRRADVVLYMDAARASHSSYPAVPAATEERAMTVVMELARELLNRSESGALLKSCGGLPGLVAEMGALLKGARTYRLRPGQPDLTADLVLSLSEGKGGASLRGES